MKKIYNNFLNSLNYIDGGGNNLTVYSEKATCYNLMTLS